MPATRTLTLHRDNGEMTSMSYFGLTVTRYHGEDFVEQCWLPQGEQPDFHDDEILIAALRRAHAWAADPGDHHLA